jgi:hypothetical protein
LPTGIIPSPVAGDPHFQVGRNLAGTGRLHSLFLAKREDNARLIRTTCQIPTSSLQGQHHNVNADTDLQQLTLHGICFPVSVECVDRNPFVTISCHENEYRAIYHVHWDEWPSTSSGEATGLVCFTPSEENHDPATNAMALLLKPVGNLYRRIGILRDGASDIAGLRSCKTRKITII